MPIYFDSTGTKRFGVGRDGESQPLGAFRLCAKTIDTKCYDPYKKKIPLLSFNKYSAHPTCVCIRMYM